MHLNRYCHRELPIEYERLNKKQILTSESCAPESAIAVLKHAIDRPVGGTASYRHVALPQSTLSL
jgi:hypothetical protein